MVRRRARVAAQLALVALLGACGSKKTPTEACAEASKHGVDTMINQARGRIATAELPEDVKARVMERQQKLENAGTKMRAVFTNRCVDDKWSAAVIGCYNKVATLDDMRACRKQLTPEQQAKLQRDELDLLAGNTGPQNFGGQGDPMRGVAADPRIAMIDSAIADAKKALAEAKTDAEKSTAQSQLTALEAEKKSLEAQVATITAEQLAKLEADVAAAKAHLDAVTADKTKSDKDRAVASADYHTARARLEQAKKASAVPASSEVIAALEAEVAQLKTQLERIEKDKTSSDKDRAAANMRYNGALERLEQAKTGKAPDPLDELNAAPAGSKPEKQ